MKQLITFVAVLTAIAPAAANAAGDEYVGLHAALMYDHPEEVLADTGGEWLPLSLLAGGPGSTPTAQEIDGYLDSFCGHEPVRGYLLTANGSTSLSVTRFSRDQSFTYTLHWTGGTRFMRTFDVAAYLGFLGLERMSEDDVARHLGAIPMEADLFRPAPDLLVITGGGRPEILGRCPG